MHTQLIADDDEDVEENPEDRDEETELMKEEMKELVRNVTKKRKEEGQLVSYLMSKYNLKFTAGSRLKVLFILKSNFNFAQHINSKSTKNTDKYIFRPK